MKILVCGISVVLAAVLMTVPFNARGNGSDRDDPAGQHESAAGVARTPPARESPTEAQAVDGEAVQLAAEPRREPTLTPQPQPREADDGWQVIRQRPPELVQRPVDAHRDQLAREQALEREAFLEHQTQQLEEFLEAQKRQLDQFLEQQDRDLREFTARQEHANLSPGQRRGVERQELSPAFDDRLAQDRTVPQSYGSDVAPVADPYPDSGSYDARPYGEPAADTYPTDDRRYVPNRRDTIEIPLPGRRTFRFRLP